MIGDFDLFYLCVFLLFVFNSFYCICCFWSLTWWFALVIGVLRLILLGLELMLLGLVVLVRFLFTDSCLFYVCLRSGVCVLVLLRLCFDFVGLAVWFCFVCLIGLTWTLWVC